MSGSQWKCPVCGNPLEPGIVIHYGTPAWFEHQPRFVPLRFAEDRSLFGRYRKEIVLSGRACPTCGWVGLWLPPSALQGLLSEEDEEEQDDPPIGPVGRPGKDSTPKPPR